MNKEPTGFARLSAGERAKVASIAGSSVPATKRMFYRDPELAKRAGRAGGLAAVAAKKKRKEESKNA